MSARPRAGRAAAANGPGVGQAPQAVPLARVGSGGRRRAQARPAQVVARAPAGAPALDVARQARRQAESVAEQCRGRRAGRRGRRTRAEGAELSPTPRRPGGTALVRRLPGAAFGRIGVLAVGRQAESREGLSEVVPVLQAPALSGGLRPDRTAPRGAGPGMRAADVRSGPPVRDVPSGPLVPGVPLDPVTSAPHARRRGAVRSGRDPDASPRRPTAAPQSSVRAGTTRRFCRPTSCRRTSIASRADACAPCRRRTPMRWRDIW